MALEIMDSMFKPEQYGGVYLGAFFYIFSLTLPHSIAANLAFPHKASPTTAFSMAFVDLCKSRHDWVDLHALITVKVPCELNE